jgi:hypothetical protein
MFLHQERGSQSFFLRYFVATPLIWLMLLPVVIADIFVELYHRVAFPIYGIPYVKRSEYIHITDRAKLPYLSWYEKLGCAYCGYVNGWLHYASVIAGRTESYFCAIAHLETKGYQPSEHEKFFMQYGDEAALKKRYFIHELTYGPDTSAE